MFFAISIYNFFKITFTITLLHCLYVALQYVCWFLISLILLFALWIYSINFVRILSFNRNGRRNLNECTFQTLLAYHSFITFLSRAIEYSLELLLIRIQQKWLQKAAGYRVSINRRQLAVHSSLALFLVGFKMNPPPIEKEFALFLYFNGWSGKFWKISSIQWLHPFHLSATQQTVDVIKMERGGWLARTKAIFELC